jgi:hypothetical protein
MFPSHDQSEEYEKTGDIDILTKLFSKYNPHAAKYSKQELEDIMVNMWEDSKRITKEQDDE